MCGEWKEEISFETTNFAANYLNDNVKIKLPIFIIHGNHDDPNGLEYLSAIDQFSVNNLLNYFGKIKSIEVIKVSPIKFQKGDTKVALYGIGHLKD